MKYLVVIEESDTGFGAYVPDLPGCVCVADSRAEVRGLIQEATAFHIEGLKAAAEPVPPASSRSDLVDVNAA